MITSNIGSFKVPFARRATPDIWHPTRLCGS